MSSHRKIVTELIQVMRGAGITEVCIGAAQGLGYAGGPEALEALLDAMTDSKIPGRIRAAAAEAAGRIVGRGKAEERAE